MGVLQVALVDVVADALQVALIIVQVHVGGAEEDVEIAIKV